MQEVRQKPEQQRSAITLITPADYERVSEIICRCLTEVNSKDYGAEHISKMLPTFAASNLGEWFKGAMTFVLRSGDEIVATMALSGNEIRTVFVDPTKHGKGFGKLLMSHLEDVARDQGLTEVTLRSSLTSKNFYEALQYEPHGETHRAVGGQMIVMRKRI